MRTLTMVTKWEFESDPEQRTLQIEVDFEFEKGHPGVAPSLSDPGEPGEGPQVGVIGGRLYSTTEELTPAQIEELDKSDIIRSRCIQHAEDCGYA